MFDCSINKYVFWMGFLIGGFIFTGITAYIQYIILGKEMFKLLKKKDEKQERKEPKL
ncbi:hypothetical protein [Acinetobacter sp. YH12211]|uniref:hypothetical protein n=1 Tax=Acinetobacter sp. YH12211 TaxID=2601147 RepID=UPI0015D20160|nr:hypothetical protein [Acinetobacter sp. YH12211]